MGGPGEPPEGTPEGPSGAEDEYRSIVFDESFVRAAPLQEYSARERITDHTLIRIAVDLLLADPGRLQGSTEAELRNSVGL